jgi:NAD(P)-dependent dehydrogenase (short-subunit alcohol dehydrogenase family)
VDGRVSLVTGGAGGIGLAAAWLLRRDGPVVVADRDPGARMAAGAEGFDTVALDVREAAQWQAVERHLRERYGRLDVLVHNAGIARIAPLLETGEEQFLDVLRVNLVSVFLGTKCLWDLLVASRGSVVNVASVSALVGQDAAAAYVASKGGVVSLTRALAVELAPHGVRVNCVCPGSTDTPLLERHFDSIPSGEEARARLVERHPIGRLLTAEDIAPAIALLASEQAAGVTGAVWVVDGGLTATFDYGTTFAGGGGAT